MKQVGMYVTMVTETEVLVTARHALKVKEWDFTAGKGRSDIATVRARGWIAKEVGRQGK